MYTADKRTAGSRGTEELSFRQLYALLLSVKTEVAQLSSDLRAMKKKMEENSHE